MSAGIQVPQSGSQSSTSWARSTDEESPSSGFPPIAPDPEDLTRLEVEFLPPLSLEEAETLAGDLDKVPFPLFIPFPIRLIPNDQAVSSATVDLRLKKRCFGVLCKVVQEYGVLPGSYFQPGVTLSNDIPYASGGFVDVWKGKQDGNQVCVKAFRTQGVENPDRIKRVRGVSRLRWEGELSLDQRFYSEIVRWKYLSHPNLLPFLGVSETLFSFSIISPWLPNGNITEYVARCRKTNRARLVSDCRDPRGRVV